MHSTTETADKLPYEFCQVSTITPISDYGHGNRYAPGFILKWLQKAQEQCQSAFNQKLLSSIDDKSFMSARGDVPDKLISDLLPNEYLESTLVDPTLHFIDRLNQARLNLPPEYFLHASLTKLEKHDSALSMLGLKQLIEYFCQDTALSGHVFSWDELNECKFNINEPLLTAISTSSTTAQIFILCADKSQRHVTGLYVMKDRTGASQAYFFDTTGISLPAHPCGLRGYAGQDHLQLLRLMQNLSSEMTIHIMPINTAKSMQSDSFSCLMATLFFFMAMHTGQYIAVDKIGIIENWGTPAVTSTESSNLLKLADISFPVALYSLNSELFLAGIQSRIAFILTLDPLGGKGDELLHSGLAATRANWTEFCYNMSKKTATDYARPRSIVAINTFWSTAYIELLRWLDQKQSDRSAPFPNFDKMMREKPRQVAGLTPFEAMVAEVYSSATMTDAAGAGAPLTVAAASTDGVSPDHNTTTPFQQAAAGIDLLEHEPLHCLKR
jgi:hypothetical protein